MIDLDQWQGSAKRHVSGIRELIQGRRASESDCNVTIAQFDSESPFDLTISNKHILDIDLETVNLIPRGTTPLYDAVGRMITYANSVAENDNVVMLIVTDGLENASVEWTLDRVKSEMEKAKSKKVGYHIYGNKHRCGIFWDIHRRRCWEITQFCGIKS